MAKQYEIKLDSGRILGPLDLTRIEELAKKGKLSGTEVARELPVGQWQDINLFEDLGQILIRAAAGTRLLQREGILPGDPDPTQSAASASRPQGYEPPEQGTVGPTDLLPGATTVLERSKVFEPIRTKTPVQTQASLKLEGHDEEATQFAPSLEANQEVALDAQDGEKTQVGTSVEIDAAGLGGHPSIAQEPQPEPNLPMQSPELEYEMQVANPVIAQEKTVVFTGARKRGGTGQPRGSLLSKFGKFDPRRFGLAALAVVAGAYTLQDMAPGLWSALMGEETPTRKTESLVRPRMPTILERADPQKSQALYQEGLKAYLLDTLPAYRAAAERFSKAVSFDGSNVKAQAMLASAYLNLIDASNKDENYFVVIARLIELSRAKAIDLPETVIADVEFFLAANKAEAAEKRIVDYTKKQEAFDLSMFYYLSLAYFQRGDLGAASRYINQIPEAKVYSAKVYYLRGQIAERAGEDAVAITEYLKALKLNKAHARSHLRIADLYQRANKLKEAQANLEFLTANTRMLSPKELGLMYYLHCQFNQLFKNWELALTDIERAVRLDRENPDYLLELYTLRAKAGDSIQSIQKHARMYYFLGEGEKQRRLGKYQEALSQYLMARQADDTSALPPLKIGDMFKALKDYANARINYRLAADRAPNSIEVWSKYINMLIESYEWDEANKAMDRFRQLPVPQSAIDKAAADMFAKQGRHEEAQVFYKKAMSRDSIDPDVYVAYAKSLMETQKFREAPFFFALALRFDPLNVEAIIGNARCVSATDSVDRAISMIQDELNKTPGARAELLTAIAEFQIQRGDWEIAQTNVKLAMEANSEYAYPWKVQARIYLNEEGSKRGALERALAAYQSFSDRNPSDPSGYLERYKLFVKKTQYERATDELRKVYAIYPKYPKLHYYQGMLYDAQGNTKAAIDELKIELANNPGNVQAMVALGQVYLNAGSLNEASAQFRLALQAAPQDAEPKHWAGHTNCLQKNFQAGAALLRAAAQIDRGNAVIYKRLGSCLLELGDGPGARQAFRRYLEMEPDAPDRAQFERFR